MVLCKAFEQVECSIVSINIYIGRVVYMSPSLVAHSCMPKDAFEEAGAAGGESTSLTNYSKSA